MQSIKKSYLIIAAIICIIGFIIPFIIKSPTDTWNTVLSSAFTILSSVVTIAAFIIAILFLDRFGVNAKFKQKQIDEVLELAKFLKDSHLHAKSAELTYIIHRKKSYTNSLNEIEYYKKDCKKEVLFSDDFLELLESLYVYMTSDWLPQEIKNKLKFIDIKGTIPLEATQKEVYIRMYIENEDSIWSSSIPKLTFEMFNLNLSDLLREIDFWLKNHSDIPVKQFD